MKNNFRENIVKKFFVTGFVVLFCAITVLTTGVFSPEINKAYAAETQADVFFDDFDGNMFSERWSEPVNAKLQTGGYSLRYDGDNGRWGACVSPMLHKITGNTEITFDIQVSGGGWLAFVFGLPRYNTSMEYADVGTWFFADSTRLMDDKNGTSGGPAASTMDDYATYRVSPWNFGRTSMRYILTKNDEPRESDGATMYKLELYMYEAGTTCPSVPQATYDNLECDGYYGFSSMGNVKATVTDFVVKENGKSVFEDNFTESAFMFDNVKVPDANWAVTYFDSSMLAIGPTADVKIITGKSGGSITNSRGIVRDSLVDKQFGFSIEANLSNISSSTVFGMELGNGKFFAGLEKVGAGEYRAVSVSSGKITETTASNRLANAENVKILFEGYSDGRIVITADDCVYTLKGGDFSGSFKIGTAHISADETEAGYVVFDNAKLQSYHYDSAIDAKDQAINFKGVRTYEESGVTLYQYYVNRKDWLMQGCTSPIYKAGQEKNYVQFSESDVNMLFGPKQKYSEFICRFSITVTDDAAKNETAVLFSFARQTLSGAAWDTPYLVFTKKPRGMEIAGGGGVSGKSVTGDVSFWNNRDAENNLITYNVMIVVIEGKLEVYFAPSDASAAEMNILRGVFEYSDTKGYMAVAGHNSASFRIGSFSVNNINAKNTNAAQKLQKDNGVQQVDESVLLTGKSQITTYDEFGDFIMYTQVKSLINGKLNIVLPNGTGIAVQQGSVIGKGLKKISSGAREEKMLGGESGIMCVRVQNGRLYVGYAAENEPVKLALEYAAEFELPTSVVRGKLTFSADDGSAVLVDSVNVYSLDAAIEIATQDYDPNVVDDIDVVKPEIGEKSSETENTGCRGSLNCVYSFYTSLGIIAFVFMILVKRCRRKEN